jgi:antitoxin VapB
MNAITKTFKSGNSEAVRIPKSLGFGIGTEIEIEQTREGLLLKPARQAKLSFQEMLARMREIGPPSDGVQEREPFEYPDRPGLFD